MEKIPISDLSAPCTNYIANMYFSKSLPKGGFIWEIVKEIKPIDLYCYLYVRFGPPNGMQNIFRNPTSDNLIHWEWTLEYTDHIILIQEHNFRIEIHLYGLSNEGEFDKMTFIKDLKEDFSVYGQKMTEFRKSSLEKWIQFVNPYYRVSNAISQLEHELDSLNITPESERIDSLLDIVKDDGVKEKWIELGVRYSKAIGICFGIKSMLPVMAESFVNMILYLFGKPEIRIDPQLIENATRQPINIRIKLLHINCNGFANKVDFSHQTCKKYNTMVNERNDLLHGNFAINKLAFNEIYFNHNVPIFIEFKSLWERSIGRSLDTVGFPSIKLEIATVNEFIEYIISCLEPKMQTMAHTFMTENDLGFNPANGHLGILLPSRLVDFRLGPKIKGASGAV